MRITRTYPQPDSDKPHLGARERALAVFKYVTGHEPEEAIKHPRFAVIVHAFEQSERKGWNDCISGIEVGGSAPYKTPDPSYCDELSSTREVPDSAVQPFQPEKL